MLKVYPAIVPKNKRKINDWYAYIWDSVVESRGHNVNISKLKK
jgi:hypothetical protein